jgi:hypothetical protein
VSSPKIPSQKTTTETLSLATLLTPETKITSLCDTVQKIRDPQEMSKFRGILEDPTCNQGIQFSLDCKKVNSLAVTKAIPLGHILSSQRHPATRDEQWILLSAKQRYGIAASLAWSVLHLNGSSWFGETLDYSRINLFLEEDESGRKVLSRYPCTLSGFPSSTSSTVTLEDSIEDDLRQFIPNTTIFLLGTLLIELCLRKPLISFQSPNQGASPVSMSDIYHQARKSLEDVYREAGDSYGDAVSRCIKFSFDGSDAHNHLGSAQFRQKFYEVVVAPIQATCIIFSSL